MPERAVRIGSAADADLRIESGGLAATQCVLEPLADGRVVVKDANSGIPTRVNGIEIQQLSLNPGDVLEVGDAKIVLRAETPAQVRAPREQSRTPREPARVPAKAASGASGPSAATPRGQPGGHRLLGPLLGLAAAAALALGLAFVLGGGDASKRASQEHRLDYALDLYRDKDYESAREVLASLAGDTSSTKQAELVELYLERTRQAIHAADAELERFWTQRLDLDLASVGTLRQVFLQQHGPALATRFDAQVEKIRKAQDAWVAERVGAARVEADALLAGEQFGVARAVWTALEREARPGADPRPAATQALADLEQKAAAAATKLLAEAQAAAAKEGPEAGLRLLESRVGRYEGTDAYARLAEAVDAYGTEIRAGHSAAAAPTPATAPPEGAPTPASVAAEKRAAETALAAADEQAAAWKFEAGRETLEAALRETLENTWPRDVLTDRLEDLTWARDGVAVLVAAITDHPERFRRVEMGPKFFVALVRADGEKVTGSVTGGTTVYRWSALPPARIVQVAARTKADGRAALALAALLREVGATEEAEPFLFEAGEGGVETTVLFPLIARWRDEEVPEGGYVAHERRWVTPPERDRLVLLARIEDGVRRVAHRDDKVWTAAAEELLALGPVAGDALVAALKARRGSVIDGLAQLRVFSSGRTKQKLFAELEKRRSHALALIKNDRAWPYPNPSGQNTDEVVARVDAVRQVWERPFDVVVGWSDEARETLEVVSDVDGYLVRADPTFKPTIDDVRRRVNLEVDMPTFTPTSKSKNIREYSLKVLAYNVKLPTTATREEQECVLAVNEYRMMMGRWAVKINERLVRAARGHSHHMREHDYFAHNVPAHKNPTAENRTPGDRARARGYGGGVGENIARGTWTGRDAFQAWFRSSGHHRNMINANWTEMGAGRSGGSWWTQLFGRAGSKKLKVPDPLPEPEAFFAPEPEDESGRPRQPGTPEFPDEPPVVPLDDPPADEDAPEDPPG